MAEPVSTLLEYVVGISDERVTSEPIQPSQVSQEDRERLALMADVEMRRWQEAIIEEEQFRNLESVGGLYYERATDWRTIASILRASPVSEAGTRIEGWAGPSFGSANGLRREVICTLTPQLGVPDGYKRVSLIIHPAAPDGGLET